MIAPEQNESYDHFVIRAHRLLQDQIPDPDERNEVIWSTWEQFLGPTEEEQLASKHFPADRYTRRRNICYFAEHSAVDGQGRPRQYGLAEMIRVARGGNERIADFDGFAPLSDGHTPGPEDPDQTMPEVLGYAGPYRLGMIGRKKPRWAVFADEYHPQEHQDVLRKRPRRSVELWTFKNDPTRMYFDPVAVLGSETPRLSLPVKYRQAIRDGAHVERYSFESPGGANTFVTGSGNMKDEYCNDGEAKKYESHSTPARPSTVPSTRDQVTGNTGLGKAAGALGGAVGSAAKQYGRTGAKVGGALGAAAGGPVGAAAGAAIGAGKGKRKQAAIGAAKGSALGIPAGLATGLAGGAAAGGVPGAAMGAQLGGIGGSTVGGGLGAEKAFDKKSMVANEMDAAPAAGAVEYDAEFESKHPRDGGQFAVKGQGKTAKPGDGDDDLAEWDPIKAVQEHNRTKAERRKALGTARAHMHHDEGSQEMQSEADSFRRKGDEESAQNLEEEDSAYNDEMLANDLKRVDAQFKKDMSHINKPGGMDRLIAGYGGATLMSVAMSNMSSPVVAGAALGAYLWKRSINKGHTPKKPMSVGQEYLSSALTGAVASGVGGIAGRELGGRIAGMGMDPEKAAQLRKVLHKTAEPNYVEPFSLDSDPDASKHRHEFNPRTDLTPPGIQWAGPTVAGS